MTAVTGESGMAEEGGVRVFVRLPQHFRDERAAAVVWASGGLRQVAGLEARLRRLFSLRGAFCLVRGGFLLPATESLRVLRDGDEVAVVPLAVPFLFDQQDDEPERDAKKKKRKKHKDKENAAPAPLTPPPLDDPGVISAIENIEKLHAELVKPDDGDDEREEEEEEVENMKSKALTLLKELAQPGVIGISDGRITKRKRVRIRKGKKNASIVTALSDSESNPPHRNNALVLLNSKINSHIRFPANDNAPVTVLRNKACKIDDKPRVVRPIQSSSETELVNGTKADHFAVGEPEPENPRNLNFVLNNLDKFPKTDVFPDIDRVIMFKMLKLDEQYNPTLSNHILGKVISACSDSQSVKFLIIDGHEECAIPTGKFDIEECEGLENNSNTEIDIAWNQVIEPRAINL